MSKKSIPQFSILQLLLFMTVLALGLMAMTQASLFLMAVFQTVTLVSLLWGMLLALFCRGSRRAYWIGFCAWGLGYIVLAGFMNQYPLENSLLTSQVLRWSYGKVVELPQPDASQDFVSPDPSTGFLPGSLVHPLEDHFMRAGQLLWGWLFAIIGGTVAAGCYRRGRARDLLDDSG